ncbi:MAG: hypothetical protein ABIE84_02160 [bacterium]
MTELLRMARCWQAKRDNDNAQTRARARQVKRVVQHHSSVVDLPPVTPIKVARKRHASVRSSSQVTSLLPTKTFAEAVIKELRRRGTLVETVYISPTLNTFGLATRASNRFRSGEERCLVVGEAILTRDPGLLGLPGAREFTINRAAEISLVTLERVTRLLKTAPNISERDKAIIGMYYGFQQPGHYFTPREIMTEFGIQNRQSLHANIDSSKMQFLKGSLLHEHLLPMWRTLSIILSWSLASSPIVTLRGLRESLLGLQVLAENEAPLLGPLIAICWDTLGPLRIASTEIDIMTVTPRAVDHILIDADQATVINLETGINVSNAKIANPAFCRTEVDYQQLVDLNPSQPSPSGRSSWSFNDYRTQLRTQLGIAVLETELREIFAHHPRVTIEEDRFCLTKLSKGSFNRIWQFLTTNGKQTLDQISAGTGLSRENARYYLNFHGEFIVIGQSVYDLRNRYPTPPEGIVWSTTRKKAGIPEAVVITLSSLETNQTTRGELIKKMRQLGFEWSSSGIDLVLFNPGHYNNAWLIGRDGMISLNYPEETT